MLVLLVVRERLPVRVDRTSLHCTLLVALRIISGWVLRVSIVRLLCVYLYASVQNMKK